MGNKWARCPFMICRSSQESSSICFFEACPVCALWGGACVCSSGGEGPKGRKKTQVKELARTIPLVRSILLMYTLLLSRSHPHFLSRVPAAACCCCCQTRRPAAACEAHLQATVAAIKERRQRLTHVESSLTFRQQWLTKKKFLIAHAPRL